MLEEFGLTKTEEKVYLALIKIGESNASEIIRKTQLHRTTVYDVLDRLIEKGVVSYIIKDKVKHFSSVNPSKFFEIATEEKTKAKKKQELAKKVIQDISVIQRGAKTKSVAQVFVGNKGQKTVMNDIIEVGQNFMILGSEGTAKETLPVYIEQWANARRKKKIKAKIIATKGMRAPIWKLNQIKFVPKEYQSPTVTIIYGNKVAIFIDEEPFLIIVIESKKLAQSYKSYFNLIWKIAKY